MVGGGQLARMSQPSAIALGITLRLLAERADDSAAQVMPEHGDRLAHRPCGAPERSPSGCDVVTFDHEHVPTEHLEALEREGHPVRPGPAALVHAQDKAVMRERLAAIGVPCPANARGRGTPVTTAAFAERGRAGRSCSSRRVAVTTARASGWSSDETAAAAIFASTGAAALLAEAYVPFERELAVLVARSPLGQAVAYPVVETRPGRRGLPRGARPGAGPRRRHGARRAARRADDRARARRHRHARGGDVPDRRGRARERACDAPAQQRPLDDRGRGDEPVRAAPAGRARPAARLAAPGRAGGGHGQRARWHAAPS